RRRHHRCHRRRRPHATGSGLRSPSCLSTRRACVWPAVPTAPARLQQRLPGVSHGFGAPGPKRAAYRRAITRAAVDVRSLRKQRTSVQPSIHLKPRHSELAGVGTFADRQIIGGNDAVVFTADLPSLPVAATVSSTGVGGKLTESRRLGVGGQSTIARPWLERRKPFGAKDRTARRLIVPLLLILSASLCRPA